MFLESWASQPAEATGRKKGPAQGTEKAAEGSVKAHTQLHVDARPNSGVTKLGNIIFENLYDNW